MLAFEEDPAGYSAVNALFFAEASRLAYRDEAEIRTTTQNWGLGGDFSFFDMDDMQGFLASDAGKIVIAFRGTEVQRPNDVLTDARTRKVTRPFGLVHEGFGGAVDLLWPLVKAEVDRMGAGKRLWITGHSLGAAMAVITAAGLLAEDYEVAGVYVFGQPRAGDRAFATGLDSKMSGRCFRIVNSIDPVPRIPPIFLGFRHQTTRVYVSATGRVVVGAGLLQMLMDSLRTRFRHGWNFKTVGVAEHGTDRYVEVLQRALAPE